MREAGAPDGRGAGAARERDRPDRGERWSGLRHDAAYYAARAAAEGRLSPEGLRRPVQGLDGTDAAGTGLPAASERE